jgi:NADP-dependent 3-hydroxy acid dehydrogenase YdfG
MTIDERLDRLTERHEALTQTVELLTTDVRELTSAVKVLAREHGKLDILVNDIAEGTVRLLRAIESHEHRISRLEGKKRET